MGNIAYCRFRNTVPDLKDCLDNLDDLALGDENPEEARARKQLIKLCRRVVEVADQLEAEHFGLED